MKSPLQSIYILALVFLPALAHGQNNFRININYSPSLPVGDFKNVTDGATWRGWEMNLLYQASPRLAVGVGGSSLSFYKKYPQTTFHEPGSDFTAVVNNAIELIPIMARVKYNLGTKSVYPFVGLGAGINVIRYDKYYGEFVDYMHVVRFAAQPELGLHIPFTSSDKVAINLGAGYNFMPFKDGEVDRLDNISFKAGLDIRFE
jgi:hypothetical protein